MSRIKLNADALRVESFEPGSDGLQAWETNFGCDSWDAQCPPLTQDVLRASCGYDPSCQRYDCDS